MGSPERVSAALGTELRVRILAALANSPMTSNELIDILDAPKATVHKNLTHLENQGLITASLDRQQRHGRSTSYRVDEQELESLLSYLNSCLQPHKL